MNPNKPSVRTSRYDDVKGYEEVDPIWQQLYQDRIAASNARKIARGTAAVQEEIVIEQIDAVTSTEVTVPTPTPDNEV